ncbi:MAG: hypothetical protein AAGB51_09235 [Planctomycetota bacterium]
MGLTQEQRAIGAQSVASIALVFAAWNFVVKPTGGGLREAQGKIEEASREYAARADRAEARPVSGGELLGDLGRRAEQIDLFLGTDGDDAARFDAYRAIAEEVGVRIQRSEPIRERGGRRGAEGPVLNQGGHRMRLRGDYASIAAFISGVQAVGGLCKVNAIKLSPVPGGDPGAVDATIETRVFWLSEPVRLEASASDGGGS